MNPQTGEVLAMTGFSHEQGSKEITENALGTITSAFDPGSVVKAGTLTAGWASNAISGNQVLIDEPIRLQGASEKTLSLIEADKLLLMQSKHRNCLLIRI